MKTIKGATGSKSGLLRKLALPFLLLIAILGIEIGGGQATPRHYATATTEIGGQNQQVPKDTNPLGIGGSQIPPRQFAVSEPIGGNQNKPQVPDPLGIEIGGSQTAPRSYATAKPIGDTNGNERRNVTKPYSPEAVAALSNETQFRQDSEITNPLGIPIGGNSCPRCGMASIIIEIPPIGGGQTPPRPIDIGGGQLPPKSPLFLSSFLTDCTVDIGGNQGIPQSPLPIGGNGGGSTAPRNYRSII